MKKPFRGQQAQPVRICGVNPVREALLSGSSTPHELLLARSDARGAELEQLAAGRAVPVRKTTREELNSLAGHSHHQGVLLSTPEFHYADLETLLEKPFPERDLLLALDNIQDPQNLGAILRSSCFLGAKGVILPRDRSAPVSPAAMKTAAGAVSYIPIARITNLTRGLKLLKDAGYRVAGLDVAGTASIYDADLSVPLCLVVGNEQKGMRRLVRNECDSLVKIPATGPLQSLNASAAVAVALSEIQRRRLGSVR